MKRMIASFHIRKDGIIYKVAAFAQPYEVLEIGIANIILGLMHTNNYSYEEAVNRLAHFVIDSAAVQLFKIPHNKTIVHDEDLDLIQLCSINNDDIYLFQDVTKEISKLSFARPYRDRNTHTHLNFVSQMGSGHYEPHKMIIIDLDHDEKNVYIHDVTDRDKRKYKPVNEVIINTIENFMEPITKDNVVENASGMFITLTEDPIDDLIL